jgi:transcriptional regulator GlxA family with amidase domain
MSKSAKTAQPTPTPRTAPIRVVFVVYEGMSLLDFSGPLGAFRAVAFHPDYMGGKLPYETHVVSATGGPVMTADGVALITAPLASLNGKTIDTLIVPGGPHAQQIMANKPLAQWIKARGPKVRRIASVCTGSFLLAAAGVLKGKRVVTHWAYCSELQRLNPDIRVEPDAIYTKDGNVWTSAGVTAGIDLAMAMIEEDLGRDLAMLVARILVVYLRRTGGQSQYSALLAAQAGADADRFAELDRWIAENLTADLRVERLAEKAGMSARNFARRYAEARKMTPARAVEAIRIDAAKRALEESGERMPQIAKRCGFSDEDQMRVAFARQLGISPVAYRTRFAA